MKSYKNNITKHKLEEKMKLFFCYNANSGFFNGVFHFLHKTFSPKTYECNLCAITFTYKMKENWLNFIKSSPYEINFVHLNHLKDFNLDSFYYETPCCILQKEEKFTILINKTRMSDFNNEIDLINELKRLQIK